MYIVTWINKEGDKDKACNFVQVLILYALKS